MPCINSITLPTQLGFTRATAVLSSCRELFLGGMLLMVYGLVGATTSHTTPEAQHSWESYYSTPVSCRSGTKGPARRRGPVTMNSPREIPACELKPRLYWVEVCATSNCCPFFTWQCCCARLYQYHTQTCHQLCLLFFFVACNSYIFVFDVRATPQEPRYS